MSFIHLHTHSHFSLLDGLSSPQDIIDTAKSQGANAVALTDHGNLFGAWHFWKACQKAEIKPLIGCEVYVAKQDRFRQDPIEDKRQYHLILLAKNYEGYQNLMKLVSLGFLEGFYYKPRVDWELLQKYSKGLIASTACLAGELPQAILEDKSDKEIDALISKFKQTFTDGFFLEVQPYDIPEQKKVNKAIFKLAKTHKLKVIATCDAHYPSKSDEETAAILARIQTNTTISEEAKVDITEFDLWMKDETTMLKAFPDHPEVISNTQEVADMIDLQMPEWGWVFPHVDVPKPFKNHDEFLHHQAFQGIEKRLKRKPDQTEIDRLEYELDIIKTKGFSSYFLTCQEITDYMHQKQIQTTTRGSAAGSLVSFGLGVTRANPLYFDLPFERFLNPLRPKAPDIDLDIADDRRDELIHWTQEKFGHDKVSGIVTFGTMAAKAAFKDVARVFEKPFTETNEIAKLIPVKWGKTNLQAALEDVEELKQLIKNDESYKQIFDIATKLEGKPRHASVHACGILITPEPITNYVPLSKDPRSDIPVAEFDMRILEDLGLCKMDFLGVRNLAILDDCRRIVKKRHKKDINPEKIPLDDPKTFELLGNAETFGIFQLESGGMRKYLKELKPTTIFDIMAMVALYRPGPMENIPEYISRKHGKKPLDPPDPRLTKILDKSLGMIVYQDDVLLTAIELAGYDWGEVDKFRKAIGKKIPELMAAQHDKFVKGCQTHGKLDKAKAEELFDLFAPFAGYGFNKSHAAAYSLLAYQTSFFKANYPIEYMAALLRAESGDSDKTTANMEECEKMGIKILPPDINHSLSNFTITDDQTIRFGLAAIKNVGQGVVEIIIDERDKNGPFKSLSGFARRVPASSLNKRLIEALAWSGALDSLGDRKQIAENYELITSFAKKAQKIGQPDNQDSLFGETEEQSNDNEEIKLPVTETATRQEKMEKEKELLGMYVSENPMKNLKSFFQNRCCTLKTLKANHDPNAKNGNGKSQKIGGMLTKLKTIITKKGDQMAFASLDSWCGDPIELVFFPGVFEQTQSLLSDNLIAIFEGKPNERNGELTFLVDKVEPLNFDKADKTAKNENTKAQNGDHQITLELPSHFPRSKMLKIKEILDSHSGPIPVQILIGKTAVPSKCSVDGSHDLLLKLKAIEGVKAKKGKTK